MKEGTAMGILSGLFRSRDKPTDRTAGSSYSFFLGGTASGKYVTERSAMQMTAVYCCVRILSEAVASLPLQFYRYTDDGGKEKAVDHPLYFLLHDEPNPEMTSFIFRETLMTHLLLWGNAYSQIIRNGKGEVVALYPLMPDRMKVDRDEHGRLYYEYTVYDSDDVDGRKGTDKVGRTVRLQPHDVLHIPGLGFDGLVGYSPIAMAKNAIGLAIATEEYGSKFFANGAAPSGVLEHPGTIKDPSKVRESWQATFGGSGNSNKIAVLEEGMKYTPISISPEQAQFLETRKFQIDEIARIFRVPPHMIGDLEKSSFNNIEQQSLEFVKYTLDPWVSRWEQAMVRALLTPDEKKKYFFKFNVDGLLRGDYQSRMNGYATARQNGWMSANDIRELENLDRIPAEQGGDLYLINGNMTKLEDAGWNWKSRKIRDQASGEEVTERVLFLNGTIAEESWFDDDVTPALFKQELDSGSGNITVWINSPGGDCVAAAQIYNMLMDYKGDVTVKIDGIAASAASVIAMAGTKVLMSPVSMMMIHNPATIAFGDTAEMQKAINMLAEVKESIMNAYEIKTGMNRTKISHLMDAETWMDAHKAVELGFADDILQRQDAAENLEVPDVSMLYSRAAVTNSLMDKISAKCHIKAPDAGCTGATETENVTDNGRSCDEIRERLNFIKRFI